MIYSEFRFTLDIRALTSQVSLGVKKGEIGRRLRIHLTENGYPYHIPDDCFAVFTAKKPDGNKIFNDCVIQDCEIFYDVTEQTVSTTGLLPCAINLYGVEGELLISATFQMIVYSAPVDQSDIESTSEYKALATLIAEAQALKDDMEEGGPGGYYLPTVEQVDDTTLRISFTPSSEEMPAVDPVEVKLPEYSGDDSSQNVELDTTLTQSGKAADAKVVGDMLATLTLGQHTDGLIYIFISGKPVGNGLRITSGEVVEPVYGNPTTDTAILKLTQNQSVVLGVKLDAEPNVSQTISVFSNSNLLSFDKTELTFTASNWSEFQFVTVTAGVFDDDATANIILRNSDKLLTDTSIPVYLQADAYSVDMTIPDGQYTVQASDFTYTTSGNWFIPTAYNGTEENIFIPATMDIDGTTYTTLVSINCFKGNTTIKYVEFAEGTRMGSAAAYMIKSAFSGCANLSFS